MTESNDWRTVQDLVQQLADLGQRPDANSRQKIDLLNDLAWQLSDTDAKRADTLGEAAYALATAPGAGEPPHLTGIASSLRTLGYLNMRMGRHPPADRGTCPWTIPYG